MTSMHDPKQFYVDPEISRAESLPSAAFTEPDFLKLEFHTIFQDSWLMVPPQESLGVLAEKGGHVPFSIIDTPLFLQRDWEDNLHCFPNVCTHAWHPLVEASGHSKTLVCPQHGRRFECNGSFISHPGFAGVDDFPRKDDSLRKLSVEMWEQFFFVTLGRAASPLHSFLGDVEESTKNIPVRQMRRVLHPIEVRDLRGNWKQHAWNYMDNFHIRFVHAGSEGLAGAVDLSSYRTELHRYSALQWVYARRPGDGFNPALLPSRFQDAKSPGRRVFALWWFVFPNLTLNFYPWGLSVNVYVPIPGRPDRTRFHWYHYVMDEEKYQHKESLWLNGQVDAEDIEAIGKVAGGAESGFAPRGRFAPKEEAGPHWFHRLVYQTVFDSKRE